ncbi:MAG: tetratricopeptide repeat protein [Bacteroidota bacterium]
MKYTIVFSFLLYFSIGLPVFAQNPEMETAATLINQRQHAKAIPLLDSLIQVQSGLPDAYFFRGLAHLRLDHIDQSIEDLTVFVEYPQSESEQQLDGLYFLGIAYRKADQLDKGIRMNDAVLTQNPLHVMALTRRYTDHMSQEAYDDAIEDCNILLKTEQPPSSTYVKRARAYATSGRRQKAFADLDRAITADSTNENALMLRADYYAYLKQYDKALADIARLNHLNPHNLEMLRLHCKILQSLDRDDEALEPVNLWLQLDSTDQFALQMKGSILLHMFRYEEAVAVFEALSEKGIEEPVSSGLLNNIGYAFMSVGKFEKSLPYYTYGLAKDPGDPYLLNNRGYAHLRLNRLEEAAEDFAQSLQGNSKNSYAVRNLALLHLAKGEKKQACKAFQKCLDMGHDQRDPELKTLQENCQ